MTFMLVIHTDIYPGQRHCMNLSRPEAVKWLRDEGFLSVPDVSVAGRLWDDE